MTRTTIRTLVLVVLLVVSVVAPFAAPAAAGTAAPSGMTTVPDSNITTDVPDGESVPLDASDLHGRILADSHASSLEVVVTTPEHADEVMASGDANVIGSGDIAVVVRDSEHHSGRDIAVDASLLKNTLGYSPEMLYGTHSSGDTWRSPARYQDGYLQFHVEKFSSNAVTFSGSVSVQGTYGSDSSVQYDLSELDSASDPVVNLTGVMSTEWDNESASFLENGETMDVPVAGGLEPDGGAAGTEPVVVLTGHDASSSGGDSVSSSGGSEGPGTSFSGQFTIEEGVGDVDVLFAGTDDGSTGGNDGTMSLTVDGESYSDKSIDGSGDRNEWTVTLGPGTHSFEISSTEEMYAAEYEWSKDVSTVDPSVTFNTGENVSYSGTLSGGETVTETVDLSTATSSLEVAVDGIVSVDVQFRERTPTMDPSVGLNTQSGGAWANQTGVLSDGETTSLSINKSALQEGTNTLEVAVGDGSLSADAPAPKVGIEYSHDAAAEKTVNYQAEQWSERYNVSHTYATQREDASLTVPFAQDVAEIRSVEKRVGGGDWETVPESSYALDGTTMDVDLGTVQENTTVDVRAVGGTVDAQNMSITVLEPSAPGERLDSRIEVMSAGTNPRIEVGDNRVTYAYNESWSADDSALFAGGDQTLRLPSADSGGTFRASTIPVEVSPVSGDVAVSVNEPQTTEPTFFVEPGSNPDNEVEYTYLNAKDDTKYILYSQTDSVVRDSGTASSPITLTDDDSEETLQFQIDDDGTSSSDSDSSGSGVLGPIPEAPSPGGGGVSGTTLLALVAVAGVAVVGLTVWRRRTGTSPASAVGESRSFLSSIGSTLAWMGRGLGRAVSWVAARPYVAGGLGALTAVVLVATGAVSLPAGATVFILVVGAPVVSYYVLVRVFGAGMIAWGAVTAVSVIMGFELLGNDVFGTLVGSEAFPIVAIGAIVIAYRGLQMYQSAKSTPQEKNEIVFETDGGDDGEDSSGGESK